MKWIKISVDKMPNREVLAANFKKGTSGYMDKIIGYIYKNSGMETMFALSNDLEVLKNVTHYIVIDDIELDNTH